MAMLRSILLFLTGVVLVFGQGKQAKQAKSDWNAPFPPHKIAGNLYYVGTSELASYLVVTPEGNILINSDYESSVPVIRTSIEKLGFKFSDTKILLGSHAHGDHMEGDALVKELTGARVMAMEQDVPGLQAMRPGGKPHPIDRVLKDGDHVTLGGSTLVAHLTPGHTKGCTTWTMKVAENGKSYDVVIVGSVNVNPGTILVNNRAYPQIAEDYVRSFKVLRSLPVDFFLGAHGAYYDLPAKYAKLQAGGANPFIDPEGYRAYLDNREQAFQRELERQKKEATK